MKVCQFETALHGGESYRGILGRAFVFIEFIVGIVDIVYVVRCCD